MHFNIGIIIASLSGAVGVVHMIQNKTDAEWMIYNASAGPYMAVVNTVVFYDVIDLLLEKSHNVAGILLYDNPAIRYNSLVLDYCSTLYYIS